MTSTGTSRPATLVVALVALLLGACSLPFGDEGAAPLEGQELADELREGGYVIYLRHTDTTAPGVDDYDMIGDCEVQRELSDEGRQDAVEIGEAFDALQVPVERVVASPFCRCTETAELAFGHFEEDEALLSLSTMEPEGDDEVERVRQAGTELIGSMPADGQNLVLVGQLSNVSPITGVGMDEGGTAIFRPDGDGGVELVAEVDPQGWQALAADLA